MSYRRTQCGRILALLRAHEGEWIGLPEILGLYIGQYNARIHELRAEGFEIENRREWTGDGQVHSWYRLVAKKDQAREPMIDSLKGEIPWYGRDKTARERREIP